jgi:hypothetical protein
VLIVVSRMGFDIKYEYQTHSIGKLIYLIEYIGLCFLCVLCEHTHERHVSGKKRNNIFLGEHPSKATLLGKEQMTDILQRSREENDDTIL